MSASLEKPISFFADVLRLSGVLHLPKQAPVALIVGCHGLMANKKSPKQIDLAHRCNAEGMAYLRFDHRGCGDSEGDFEKDTTLKNRQADLLAAVRAARRYWGYEIFTGLFGSSLGGAVCLMTSSHISPFATVTLAAPIQSHFIRMPEDSPESLNREILKNRLNFDITNQLSAVHHILIVHGDGDETVSIENAHQLYKLAHHPKKKVILKSGDHRISNPSHQKIFMQHTVKWFLDCLRNRVTSIETSSITK
jgi:alpha/beta superfamily hydrolase